MEQHRHRSRQLAMQVLYAREYLNAPPEDIANRLHETENISKDIWNGFARELAYATLRQHKELDAEIQKSLKNWRVERLSRVDLILLRMALCEMRDFPDIPLRVTLNEYIELAKRFGTEESAQFVNGILDNLGKGFSHKDVAKDKTETKKSGEQQD